MSAQDDPLDLLRQPFDHRRFLLDNPDAFLLHYFGDKLGGHLKDFHVTLINTALTKRRGLILFPAAHGKTTIISTLLPIYALCLNPNVRVAIITKNDMDAKAIMQAIQAELLGNAKLIEDFGPFYPEGDSTKPWALERMSVANRTIIHKSATLAAFGAGSRSAIGYRTDWTICDDIVTDRNSATPEQRAKLREWFMLGPETMGETGDSRVTVIGTLFHPDDLYHELRNLQLPGSEKPIYQTDRFDAIVDEDAHTVLWPEQRPWLWLMEKKASQGTLEFNKRYRNIAVDPSRMVFREEYVDGGWLNKVKYPGCLDRDYRVGDTDPTWKVVAGFDPAIGITSSRKFCAHLTLAVGSCAQHDKCLWVVDLERDQFTLPQQVELILTKHRDYRLHNTFVEANAYQAGLLQAIKDKMGEAGVAYRISPHYTTRTNKPDPELGVQAMSPWFENGQVHIPWADPHSQKKMQVLRDELKEYPGKYTDTVMAFWMAWRAADLSASTMRATNYLAAKPLGTLAPTWRRRVRNPAYT